MDAHVGLLPMLDHLLEVGLVFLASNASRPVVNPRILDVGDEGGNFA